MKINPTFFLVPIAIFISRVKSGIFGQTAKRPFLFHISNIGIKNKLTKQIKMYLMFKTTLYHMETDLVLVYWN